MISHTWIISYHSFLLISTLIPVLHLYLSYTLSLKMNQHAYIITHHPLGVISLLVFLLLVLVNVGFCIDMKGEPQLMPGMEVPQAQKYHCGMSLTSLITSLIVFICASTSHHLSLSSPHFFHPLSFFHSIIPSVCLLILSYPSSLSLSLFSQQYKEGGGGHAPHDHSDPTHKHCIHSLACP